MTVWTRFIGALRRDAPFVRQSAIARVEMDAPTFTVALVTSEHNGKAPTRSVTLTADQHGIQVEMGLDLDELLPELQEADRWLRSAPCPCGEPVGGPPCTVEKPCPYAEGMPAERWRQ